MDEVPGAIERPHDSHITVVESPAGFTINIPPTRLPIIVKAVVLLGALGVIAFCIITLQFLIFHHSIVLDHDITKGEFRAMPAGAIAFYSIGYVLMTGLSTAMVFVAAIPLTRRERIIFANGLLKIERRTFGRSSQQTILNADIRDFLSRRDRSGPRESNLLVRLKLGQNCDGKEEIEVGLPANEAEKQWLASVLNVILSNQPR